ncbi:MAG: TnsA endonuclease N-terminal domain-containing protein [Sterolibacterium sp.]|nr:TnsA endonuclease N-terminal domain-containing protein [Sterolibacterium sp.]
MRTTKRFTPKVIARFIRQGRGEGTYADYVPWHRVSRGDPASSGRSHLLMWRDRLRELLSDGELGEQLSATMLPDLDDSLEQFKLPPEDASHPLAEYGERDLTLFPGTEKLAKQLGIKHPIVRDADETALWRPTTDLVLVFKPRRSPRRVLALAFKPSGWNKSRRTRQLLCLEREFWLCRDIDWLLITPDLYDARVVLTLRRIACWALGEEAQAEVRSTAAHVARQNPIHSVSRLLEEIQALVGSLELAQRALWQAIWYGELPVDLRCGWRPHVPLKHISPNEFTALNPIAARRSSWI